MMKMIIHGHFWDEGDAMDYLGIPDESPVFRVHSFDSEKEWAEIGYFFDSQMELEAPEGWTPPGCKRGNWEHSASKGVAEYRTIQSFMDWSLVIPN